MKKLVSISALALFAIAGGAQITINPGTPVGLYAIALDPGEHGAAQLAWARAGEATNESAFEIPELIVIDPYTGQKTIDKKRFNVTAKNGLRYECYFFDASSAQGSIAGTQKKADEKVFSWEIRGASKESGGAATLFLAPFYKFVGKKGATLGLQFAVDISSLQSKINMGVEIQPQDIAALIDAQHVDYGVEVQRHEHTFRFTPLYLKPQMHILPYNGTQGTRRGSRVSTR